MGLCMAKDYAQEFAQRKAEKRGNTRMTMRRRGGKTSRMPRMSTEARKAYDPEKIRAAMAAVMAEKNLRPRPWAEKAGVSPGSVYSFLEMDDPDAKPGAKQPKPTEAPQIRMFVRLAWAAGVSVSRLIGEPQATIATSTGPVEPATVSATRQLALMIAEREEQLLVANRRIYELQLRVEEMERTLRSRQQE